MIDLVVAYGHTHTHTEGVGSCDNGSDGVRWVTKHLTGLSWGGGRGRDAASSPLPFPAMGLPSPCPALPASINSDGKWVSRAGMSPMRAE